MDNYVHLIDSPYPVYYHQVHQDLSTKFDKSFSSIPGLKDCLESMMQEINGEPMLDVKGTGVIKLLLVMRQSQEAVFASTSLRGVWLFFIDSFSYQF